MSFWDDIASTIGNIAHSATSGVVDATKDVGDAITGTTPPPVKATPLQPIPSQPTQTAQLKVNNPIAQQQPQQPPTPPESLSTPIMPTQKKKGPGLFGDVENDISNAVPQAVKDVFHNPVSRLGGQLAKGTANWVEAGAKSVYDMGRGAVGSATGNKVAVVNANKAKATNYPQFASNITRPLLQGAEEIAHPFTQHSFTPTTPDQQELLGTRPVQNLNRAAAQSYKQGIAEGMSPLEAGLKATAYTGGQTAYDALTLSGVKSGVRGLSKSASYLAEATKPLDDVGGVKVPSPAPEESPETSLTDKNIKAGETQAGKGSGPTPTAQELKIGKALGMSKDDVVRAKQQEENPDLGQPPATTPLPASPLEAAQDKQLNLPKQNPAMTPEQRQALIDKLPDQKTNNQIKLVAQTPEAAVGETEGILDKSDKKFNDAYIAASKIKPKDQQALEDAVNGKPVSSRNINAKHIQNVADKIKDALDYHLAAKRVAGATTLRYNKGNYAPLFLKADTARLDELGIPKDQQYDLGNGTSLVVDGKTIDPENGFKDAHDTERKYTSYEDAKAKSNGILVRANPDLATDLQMYHDMSRRGLEHNLLYTQLHRIAPNEITPDLNQTKIGDTQLTHAAKGNLPYNVSDRLNNALKGYKSADFDNLGAEIGLKALEIPAHISRAVAFLFAPVHYMNLTRSTGLNLAATGHEIEAAKFGSQAWSSVLHPKIYDAFEKSAMKEDGGPNGSLDGYVRHMGGKLADTKPNLLSKGNGLKGKITEKYNPFAITRRNLSRFNNIAIYKLYDVARRAGVKAGTEQGRGVASELNMVADRINSKMEKMNPMAERLLSTGSLAPHWIRANLQLVRDTIPLGVKRNYDEAGNAVKGVKGVKLTVGKGLSKGYGMTNAGDIARANVLGGRALEAAIAITAGAIATGKMPNFTQAVNEAGLNPNNPVPNVQTGQAVPNTPANRQTGKAGESQVLNLPTDPIGMAVGLFTDPQHFFTARENPIFSAVTQGVTGKNFNEQYTYNVNAPKNVQNRQKLVGGLKALEPFGLQNAQNNYLDTAQKVEQSFGLRTKTNPNTPSYESTMQYVNAVDKMYNNATPQDANILHAVLGRQLTNSGQKVSPGTVGSYNSAVSLIANYNTGGKALQDYYNAMHSIKGPNDPLWKLPLTAPAGKPSVYNYLWIESKYVGSEKDGAKMAMQGSTSKGWLTNLDNARNAYYSKLPPSPDAPANEPAYPNPSPAVNNELKQYDGISNPSQAAQYLDAHQDVTDWFASEFNWTQQIRKLEGAPALPAQVQPTPQVESAIQTYDALPASKTAGNTNPATQHDRENWINANKNLYNQMTQYFANSSANSLLKDSVEAIYSGQDTSYQPFLKEAKSTGSDVVQNKNGSYSLNAPAASAAASSSSSSSSSPAFTYYKMDLSTPNNLKLKTKSARHIPIKLATNYWKQGKVLAKVPQEGKTSSNIPIAGVPLGYK